MGDATAGQPGPARPRLIRGAAAFWRVKPGISHFTLGAILAVPFAVLAHAPVLPDTDSGRLLASVIHVGKHGFQHILDTQEVLLPHILIPAFVPFGIEGVQWLPPISLVLLAGTVAYVSGALTRSLVAVVAAPLALVSFHTIYTLTDRLTMYLLMLTLGYLGLWVAYISLRTGGKRAWGLAAVSAALLVLTSEAHGIGQLFLVSPALLLVVRADRRSLAQLARVFLSIAVLMIPRILINLSVGGLEAFRTNRADYWVTNGYIQLINMNFWRQPVSKLSSPLEYLGWVDNLFVRAVGDTGAVAVAFVILAFVLSKGRGRWFGVVAGGFFLAALLTARPAPLDRYIAPLLPGAAIAAGVGVAALIRLAPRIKWAHGLALLAFLIGATGSYLQFEVRRDEYNPTIHRPFFEAAEVIDDGKAVIGSRTPPLQQVTTEVEIYGSLFLSEPEYLTYLTWPSDQAVIQMFENRNIGWVMVLHRRDLEVAYHQTWVGPAHGLQVRHPEAINQSPNFCLAGSFDGVGPYFGLDLYRLGSCNS